MLPMRENKVRVFFRWFLFLAGPSARWVRDLPARIDSPAAHDLWVFELPGPKVPERHLRDDGFLLIFMHPHTEQINDGMFFGEFCLLELTNSGVRQHAQLHILAHANINVIRSLFISFALEYVGDPQTSATMHSREVEHAVSFFAKVRTRTPRTRFGLISFLSVWQTSMKNQLVSLTDPTVTLMRVSKTKVTNMR